MLTDHLKCLHIVLIFLSPICFGSADQTLPAGVDPVTGYRLERYRAPVPDTIPGGKVLSTQQALEAFKSGEIVFIDVYPPKGLGPDPLDGSWVTNEQHENIPGSIWLPEVGRGHLDPDAEAYFRRNLDKITKSRRSQPILFYCTADCWQSWNAARRALSWGFTDVYWFPNGTDGWLDEERELILATPLNFLQ